jgi:hypothetical protein
MLLMMTLLGNHPLWPVKDLTLAEAALLRDEGEMARLLGSDEDPNGRYRIRRTLVHRSLDPITPLEAAARANRAVMVNVLLANGAVPDSGTWTAVCESERNEIHAIRALLEPLTSSPSCPPRRDADQPATLH